MSITAIRTNQTIDSFLLFRAENDGHADALVCETEVLIEETLEGTGVSCSIEDFWPVNPGEYSADMDVNIPAGGPSAEQVNRLLDRALTGIGVSYNPQRARAATELPAAA